MREIKFRAWNKNFREYGEVVSIDWITKDISIVQGNEIALMDFSEVVLEQYTGLKDKNGVEIYEGDIVSTPKNDVASVIFIEGLFTFEFNDNLYNYWEQERIIELYFEVIGNIHQNKELLND